MTQKPSLIYSLILLALLSIAGITSVTLNQDANWDLKNYHIYNAWSYLHDRERIDIAAAGIQTYFSPFIDIPYYYLSIEWLSSYPRLVAFIQGLPYGIVLFGTYLIFKLAFEELGITKKAKYLSTFIYGTIGTTGVATISQVGTTFNEIQVAALVISAVAICSRSISQINNTNTSKLIAQFFVSGLLIGSAAGLKLTAAIYSPAFILSLLIASNNWNHRFNIIGAAAIGCTTGFLAFYSPWALHLYSEYSNPVFPLFNSIFRSDWGSSSANIDTRFLPKSTMEYLFYPLYWAKSNLMTVMEPAFSDFRFAIAQLCLISIITLSLGKRFFLVKNISYPSTAPLQVSTFLIAFLLISYLTWLNLFSILRYAVPIEALSGFFIAFAIILFSDTFFPRHRNALLSTTGLTVILALIGTTKYPDWGRINFGERVYSIDRPQIEPNSLVILISKPLAFYAPFLADSSSDIAFLGYSDIIVSDPKSKSRTEFERMLGTPNRPIYALARSSSMLQIKELHTFGLQQTGECVDVKSNIDNDIHLCKLKRLTDN